ncbi:hypothetical protein WJX81_001943 [Elliptochloris bilobata]|uniref:Uncharacterized protein n=1 Tax=Elliptochloris bilobata TaxID=381761 RepID=A0AAW1SIA8_9CHLO
MGLFACFAPPRVLDDESTPRKGQLQELYVGKLQQQRSLETPKACEGSGESLRLDEDKPPPRGLCDSRGSDGCGSVTFPTVWHEDEAEIRGDRGTRAAAAPGHSEQAAAEAARVRGAPSAAHQALEAVVEEGLCELAALARAHQAACETGLGAAPATVLLPPAPGSGVGTQRATASEVDARGRTCARTLPRLGAFPYLAPDGAAAEALVLLPPAGTSARALRRAISGAGVQLPGTGSLVLEAFPRARAPPAQPPACAPRAVTLDPYPTAGPMSPPCHKRSPSGACDEWGAWDALCAECPSAQG